MPLELSQNYFELFRLPCALEVDERQLTEQYRVLQRELHPDRFAAAGSQEKRLAAQAAAHVNQAYRTLNDRHERATYLLQLRGVVVDDEKDTATDAEFLMQQMELREGLEELGGLPEAEAFGTRLEREAGALWEDFGTCYAGERWLDAREVLLKLRFYRRLQQQLQIRREQFSTG